jgi:uncharacterized protein (UPF0305 family)
MRTIKITDETHKKLTVTLGSLMARTGTLQTYSDATEALISSSVTLNPDLIAEVEKYVDENKQQGYMTREEFIAEAIRFFLKWESEEYEYIEIPKEKYDKLNDAVKKMRMPYYNAAEFMEDQINKALEQYEKFLEEK